MDRTKVSPAVRAARRAVKKGVSPIPIPRKSKAPDFRDWINARYTDDEIEPTFKGQNIGVLLGEASEGLVDVDLDSPAARELAPLFLPPTKMIHGRDSAPLSHWWYRVPHPPKVQKYTDPLDKASLVELRGTGGQTVVPPSVHPTGEKLRWHSSQEGWSAHDAPEVRRVDLEVAVSRLAAAALLAKYWPDPGSRHDAALALCGGLLRGGWSPTQVSEFVIEVAEVGGDEEARERRLDVGTTQRRIEQGKSVQGWPSLESAIEPDVVRKAREWLRLDVTEDEETGEIERLRNKRALGQAIAEGIEDPPQVVPGLLYAGMVHWWQGEPESGKTLLLLSLALDLVRRGRSVMLVDEESGLAMTADRLARMGADPGQLDQYFHYYEMPGLTLSEEDRTSLLVEVEEIAPDLVIFDSCADLLTQAGMDEDDAFEITTYYRSVLQPIAHEHGAAVAMIDHVVKSKEARGTYARGSGAKKAKTDVAWTVTPQSRFALDPPKIGLIELKIAKDRLGRLPGRVAFRVGGTAAGKTIVEQVKDQGGSVIEPTDRIRVDITNFLLEHAGSPDQAISTRTLRQEIEGKAETIQEVLEGMENSPESLVRSRTHNGAKLWWASDNEAVVEVDFS